MDYFYVIGNSFHNPNVCIKEKMNPSINGFTHNNFKVNDFVWFKSGNYEVQAQILKIYTETDDINTKVTYYIQWLNCVCDCPFSVIEQENLYISKKDLLKSII